MTSGTAPPVAGPDPTSPTRQPTEAESFDLGDEGSAYHDCDATNNGGAYRPASGVDIEACAEGGYNVGWMCAGEWIEYTVDVAAAGPYVVEARVASQSTGGEFHLEFDGTDVTGAMLVPATGGWQTWTSIEARAELAAGAQIMRFANDSTSEEYNLNHFRLLSAADLNRDGEVDGADMSIFVGCVAGPDVTVAPPGCSAQQFERSDLDLDEDVDVQDVKVFQTAFGL